MLLCFCWSVAVLWRGFSIVFDPPLLDVCVPQVFHACLFDVPSSSTPRDSPPPKCKHAASRRVAFALLQELATDCPSNMAALCAEMVPHHDKPAVSVCVIVCFEWRCGGVCVCADLRCCCGF